MVDASGAEPETEATAAEGSGKGGPDGAAAVATSTILKDLLVLPPLTKSSHASVASKQELIDAVALPPIRAEEPVQSLRTALSEVCGYAHLTNFRLQLIPEPLGIQRKGLLIKQTNG